MPTEYPTNCKSVSVDDAAIGFGAKHSASCLNLRGTEAIATALRQAGPGDAHSISHPQSQGQSLSCMLESFCRSRPHVRCTPCPRSVERAGLAGIHSVAQQGGAIESNSTASCPRIPNVFETLSGQQLQCRYLLPANLQTTLRSNTCALRHDQSNFSSLSMKRTLTASLPRTGPALHQGYM